MPRYLGRTDNKVKLVDGISGAEIEFSYRTPSTTELQEYFSSGVIKDADGKAKLNGVVARVAFAKEILTGIRDGDFLDAEGKPISSDASSADFRTDWKDLVEQGAADLLNLFVLATFDRTVMQTQEDALPLAKSSGD